jgi:hypothetical protein
MKLSSRITLFGLALALSGSFAAYGLAQPKPVSHSDAGTPPGSCHMGMDCPMNSLATLADVKLEKTKTGASLQFTAKDVTKVSEVQALVEKMSEHMKNGGCPMMKGKGGPEHAHEHGHEHGEHAHGDAGKH